MDFSFDDKKMLKLFTENKGKLATKFPAEVVVKFFSVMEIITSLDSTDQLRQFRGLNFEALKGDRAGQHSLRLNDQFRLIIEETEDDDGQLLLIIEITDYH